MDWAKEINKLRNLAKVDLEKSEAERIASQLTELGDYFKKSREVPTEGISRGWQMEAMENIWREDEPRRRGIDPEILIEEAPRKRGRFIEVTGVFK